MRSDCIPEAHLNHLHDHEEDEEREYRRSAARARRSRDGAQLRGLLNLVPLVLFLLFFLFFFPLPFPADGAIRRRRRAPDRACTTNRCFCRILQDLHQQAQLLLKSTRSLVVPGCVHQLRPRVHKDSWPRPQKRCRLSRWRKVLLVHLAVAVLCPLEEWSVASATAIATDNCSCRNHERSRRSVRLLTAPAWSLMGATMRHGHS